MGTKGNNQNSYECYEELPMLRVSPDAEIPYIYKRKDNHLKQPVEERNYQIRIPVPKQKGGIRKSLRTENRDIIELVEVRGEVFITKAGFK